MLDRKDSYRESPHEVQYSRQHRPHRTEAFDELRNRYCDANQQWQ